MIKNLMPLNNSLGLNNIFYKGGHNMFNQNGGYSLADIAAATNGNGNGFFGNDGAW